MPFRKIFFYFLVFAFFLLLPLLLIYSFGFRWDPVGKTITRTGIITIKTFPEGAEVYLNNMDLKRKTDFNLTGLMPRTYDIELKLDGYWPYNKKVKVKPEHVDRLENVRFFPKAPKFKSVFQPQKFDGFSLSPDGKKILFFIDESGDDENFYLLNLKDRVLKALWKMPGDRLVSLKGAQVSWSDDEDLVLIQKKDFVYLLSLKKPELSFFLDSVLEPGFKNVKFSQTRDGEVYYMKDGRIYQYDVRKKREKGIFFKDVLDYEPTDFGLLWIEAGSSNVMRSDREGRGIKLFGSLKNFQGILPLKWQSSPQTLIPFEKRKWGALDPAGNFYVLNPPFYHPAVKGFRFSPSGERVLYWNNYELWVLEEELPENREPGSPRYERRLVFESEIPIQDAFWSASESYVFFLTHRKVYTLELNTRGGMNLYPVYVSKDHFVFPQGWAFDPEADLFYWTSENPERARELKVLSLSVGFLEPIMEKVADRVEDFKSKMKSSGLLRKSSSKTPS